MRKRRFLITLATVTAALAAAGGVSAVVADPANEPRAKIGIDDDLLTQKLDALGEISDTAVIAEIRSGDDVWAQARGTRTDGGGDAAKPTDRARVGSVTKSMVATVVLQLVDEGELNLDDSIHDLAPGLLPYEQTITVRQLLGHTAGVPDYIYDLYPSLADGSPKDITDKALNRYEPADIIAASTQRDLDFEPGSKYSYSNTGYFVIGLLVEKLTGNPVEDEVEQRVLQPADMDETQIPQFDPTIDGDHVNAYFEVGDKPGVSRVDTSTLSPTHLWAAGAAISSPADMNRLYRAMFDGTLLPTELLDEARTFSKQSEGAYGLGLQSLPAECEAIDGGIAMGHTGGGLGHTTYSFHSADADTQVSFTFASDPQALPTDPSMELYDAVVDFTMAGLCGDDAPSVDGSEQAPIDAAVSARS